MLISSSCAASSPPEPFVFNRSLDLRSQNRCFFLSPSRHTQKIANGPMRSFPLAPPPVWTVSTCSGGCSHPTRSRLSLAFISFSFEKHSVFRPVAVHIPQFHHTLPAARLQCLARVLSLPFTLITSPHTRVSYSPYNISEVFGRVQAPHCSLAPSRPHAPHYLFFFFGTICIPGHSAS